MLNIIISGISYKLITKQSELNYSTGKMLEDLIEEYKNDLDNIEFQKWFLGILLNVDYDIIDLIKDEQVSLLVKNCFYFQSNQLKRFPLYLKIKKKIYKYKDFDLPITVEEYSELDQLSIDKDEKGLFFLLYLPIKKKLRHILLKNFNSINNLNYYIIKISIWYYYQYKQNLMKEYGLNYDNENIPEEQIPDEIELEDIEKFGMYHILMEITNNDYDKMKLWLGRNIKELFKFLFYIKLKSVSNKINE